MAIGFSIPVFFVILRECTEASIVMSVLFTFIRSMFASDAVMRRKLSRALWAGTLCGIALSLAIGTVFLVIWFKYASNLWASTEALWEAIFQLIAAILLLGMALMFMKSDSLMDKWNRKLTKALKEHNIDVVIDACAEDMIDSANREDPGQILVVDKLESLSVNTTTEPTPFLACDMTNIKPSRWECSAKSPASLLVVPQPTAIVDDSSSDNTKNNPPTEPPDTPRRATSNSGMQAFFWIPFITILREGLEGMIFLGGIAISDDPGHIPLAVLAGLLVGIAIGYVIYRAGSTMKLHTFFISATVLILYLAAGLFSKSVWSFELNTWAHQVGSTDPDTLRHYNVQTNVWHLQCCDPQNAAQGGWQLFNAILGWTNSPTVGSVVSYILFWLGVSALLVGMKLMDRRRVRLGREKVGFKRMIKMHVHQWRGQ
ncbi:iron permease FTR1 family-domain-containing protein [Chytriomyces sp. MP71]|nr:iron permease FTR1 family-domain-containing protein [Chytriomyces sp. MP71]